MSAKRIITVSVLAAQKACDCAPQDPDADRDQRGGETDGERDPSPNQNAGQQITTERISAEKVLSIGRFIGDLAFAVGVAFGDLANDFLAIRCWPIQKFIFQIGERDQAFFEFTRFESLGTQKDRFQGRTCFQADFRLLVGVTGEKRTNQTKDGDYAKCVEAEESNAVLTEAAPGILPERRPLLQLADPDRTRVQPILSRQASPSSFSWSNPAIWDPSAPGGCPRSN